MKCYREGGCGPYENRPCSQCPASRPEYAERGKLLDIASNQQVTNPLRPNGFDDSELSLASKNQVTSDRKTSDWISVKDRLPEVGKIVLVRQTYSWERMEDGAEITIGRLSLAADEKRTYWEFQHYRPDFRSGTVMDNDIIRPGSEYVSHWMPLPEPPKEG